MSLVKEGKGGGEKKGGRGFTIYFEGAEEGKGRGQEAITCNARRRLPSKQGRKERKEGTAEEEEEDGSERPCLPQEEEEEEGKVFQTLRLLPLAPLPPIPSSQWYSV